MVCRYSGGAAQGLPQAQDYIRMVLEEGWKNRWWRPRRNKFAV